MLSLAAKDDLSWMKELAQSVEVPLLLGVDTHHFGPQGERIFNSAAYVARDGRLLGATTKCTW